MIKSNSQKIHTRKMSKMLKYKKLKICKVCHNLSFIQILFIKKYLKVWHFYKNI